MFTRPKTPPPKPLQSLKLLLTSSELIILQKDSILSRVPLDPGTGGFFMAVGGRTRGDRVRVWGIGGADREVMDEIAAQKK